MEAAGPAREHQKMNDSREYGAAVSVCCSSQLKVFFRQLRRHFRQRSGSFAKLSLSLIALWAGNFRKSDSFPALAANIRMASVPISAQASAPAAVPQPVSAPLTNTAIFLVATIDSGDGNRARILSLCADLSAFLRAIGFRAPEGALSCILGFGSDAWDCLFGPPRPAELHPFHQIRSGPRHAVSTPGDLIFHIRAKRMDLCFELATHIVARLDGAVTIADEVHGFRYFDQRDLLGFVDGTENPTGSAAADAVFIGDEDPAFAGGSYVIVQKYLHNLDAWNRIPTEAQEKIIGRTKVSDIELDDTVKPSSAHNALTVIEENGREIKILRDNMPFGRPGHGEFGTYFIGYSRSPRTIEQMLQNMFIGRPPGNYDRILDFSTAVTGSLFFIPTSTFLDNVFPDRPAPSEFSGTAMPTTVAASGGTSASTRTSNDGSLGIGSLKEEGSCE
jgi:putative iron-dependent peroxidase